jgi:uncharacterized membrane protein YhaH (DUF805 family)
MLEMLFSAKGRINRAPFWGYSILSNFMFYIPMIGLTVFAVSSQNNIYMYL